MCLISLESVDICKISVLIFILRIEPKASYLVYLVSVVPQYPVLLLSLRSFWAYYLLVQICCYVLHMKV